MAPRGDERATAFENALADEILAEVARQRLTARSVQNASGVKPRAWSNYLTARVRHIPLHVVDDICEVLGVRSSEMLRRAEVRSEELDTHSARAEAALARVSPEARRRARKIAREVRPQPSEEDVTRSDRMATAPITRTASTGR